MLNGAWNPMLTKCLKLGAPGFAKEPIATAESHAAYSEHMADDSSAGTPASKPLKTDTLSAVALDSEGHVSAAVTTSG